MWCTPGPGMNPRRYETVLLSNNINIPRTEVNLGFTIMTVFMFRVVNHRHHATSRAAYKKLSREGSCKDQIMLITSMVERQEIEQAYYTS